MIKSENNYRNPNNCPYCGYFCDAASRIGNTDETSFPKPGDLSFCLMCVNPMEFDESMKLKKFDINSIKDIHERNRIKSKQLKMESYWEVYPDTTGRREKYLKNMDDKNE